MKKVVLFYVELSHYRIPILQRIAQRCDLTVVYGKGSASVHDLNFKIVQVPVKKVGPFYFFDKDNFFDYLKRYDIVIGLMDLRLLQFMFLCFWRRTFKLVLWGIGVSASYNKKFNVNDVQSKLRTFVASRADALVFYSDVPLRRFLNSGFSADKLYVANNTIDNIVPLNLESQRDSIIFVGTLYRAKGLETLINIYSELIKHESSDIPKLLIVGAGELLEELKSDVQDKGLTDKVEFAGAVYDSNKLKSYFDRAIFTVSPNQAGLSVLTSMSYGVPFVTCKDAITGGEILNIKNGYNGFLLNNVDELADLIVSAGRNPETFLEMGKNAFNFYREERHPDMMANAIIKCIEEI